WDIQSGHRGIDIEIIYFEMRLVLEQQIMHGPEAVLESGGFRGFRCELCMRMFLDQGEMPVHEPHPIGESSAQPTNEEACLSAVGAFEIAVGNNGKRGRPPPHYMIV